MWISIGQYLLVQQFGKNIFLLFLERKKMVCVLMRIISQVDFTQKLNVHLSHGATARKSVGMAGVFLLNLMDSFIYVWDKAKKS